MKNVEDERYIRKSENELKKKWIYVIYCCFLLFFIYKTLFYSYQNVVSPDMNAHLSYLIYDELNDELFVPEFENMKMYSTQSIECKEGNWIYTMKQGGLTCYLGHPPFYYKLINLFNPVSFEGESVIINYSLISYLNILMVGSALVMVLFEGFVFFSKRESPIMVHLFFVISTLSLPMYGFMVPHLNNDNLCNVGAALVFVGVLSYIENGYTLKTYAFLCLGMTVCVLAKLTLGLIIIIALAVLVVFDIIKNRNLQIFKKKEFFLCSIVFIIPLVYFILVHIQYGSFQPSYAMVAPSSEYLNSSWYVNPEDRVILSKGEFWDYFISEISWTWTANYSNGWALKRQGLLHICYMVVLFLFVLQVVRELVELKKEKRNGAGIAVFAGILLTMFIHFVSAYGGYLASGRIGAAQSRYYMPCIVFISFSASCFIGKVYGMFDMKKRILLDCLIIPLLICILYSDFFFYLSNCYKFSPYINY